MDAYLERALAPLAGDAVSARTHTLVTADGFSLAATVYEPAASAGRTPRAVVINSATAVRRRYYDVFARFLAAGGLHVLTYDYRGIGDSRPRHVRAVRARMRDWGERDFAAALDFAWRELGDPAPRVVGHSAGGQIVGLAPNNERASALLFVGAQSGDWRAWPAPARPRMVALWYGVIPALTTTFGYLPGAVLGGEPLPAGVAREWARWGRRRDYLVGGRDDARREGFRRLHVPLLAYSFEDDTYAPEPTVRALLDLYAGADVRHRHVDPRALGRGAIGHFGFFRERQREPFWFEARDFLASAPASARAAGAAA